MQIHGGIGVTFEHDLHLYLRRLTVNRSLAGTPAEHRRLAALHRGATGGGGMSALRAEAPADAGRDGGPGELPAAGPRFIRANLRQVTLEELRWDSRA